jgi:hypothetical protein
MNSLTLKNTKIWAKKYKRWKEQNWIASSKWLLMGFIGMKMNVAMYQVYVHSTNETTCINMASCTIMNDPLFMERFHFHFFSRDLQYEDCLESCLKFIVLHVHTTQRQQNETERKSSLHFCRNSNVKIFATTPMSWTSISTWILGFK